MEYLSVRPADRHRRRLAPLGKLGGPLPALLPVGPVLVAERVREDVEVIHPAMTHRQVDRGQLRVRCSAAVAAR